MANRIFHSDTLDASHAWRCHARNASETYALSRIPGFAYADTLHYTMSNVAGKHPPTF